MMSLHIPETEVWKDTDEKGSGLMMLGVCLENVVGPGRGPALNYVSPGILRSLKLSHPEMAVRLQTLSQKGIVDDCWIWNTCNRFEVYATYTGNPERIRNYILKVFFAPLADKENGLNEFYGCDVLHHLLRTVVGLNSGLPGETDVEQQLKGSIRVSHCLGLLSEDTEHLLEAVMAEGRKARAETSFQEFSPNYCLAALENVFESVGSRKALSGPISVIGSSNTCRTCVDLLENHFEVDHSNITVYHRCHGKDGQMKMIRRTSHGCSRMRVEDYTSPEIAKAVASSSLVIFGIDRNKPILTAERLREYCTETASEVLCIDFNTFGSTEGLEAVPGVRIYNAQDLEDAVREYARKMAESLEFQIALQEIEPVLETTASRLFSSHFKESSSWTDESAEEMMCVAKEIG